MQDFTGKVALVTGASTGIGEAIAQELVDCGAKVAITARNRARLAATAQRIDPTGKSVFPLVMDARDPESVRSAVAQTVVFCFLQTAVSPPGPFTALMGVIRHSKSLVGAA